MGSVAAPPCHLVAVPYPGRGHVNAMLNLCRLLAARDDGVSAITVVVTEEWLGLLGAPAALPDLGPRVHFEAIPNVIPSEHGRANDVAGFLEAVYTKMAAPFERLLDRLEPPAAIVADAFVPWTVDVGERRGVPVCLLCPISATTFAVQHSFHRLPPKAAAGGDGLMEDYIPGTRSIRFADLGPTHTDPTKRDKILEAHSYVKRAQCVIVTSFEELESDAISALRRELPCPVYAVGPCIPFMALQEERSKSDPDVDGHMAWLDAQPAGSVLYVSLGSFLSVSGAQFEEMAAGLAQSKVRFLWVLRDADARSRVVRGLAAGGGHVVPWTDQLRVLCHPSVGGFFTHCGMNSTLEAVYAGVPMLTLPIAFDQPINSRLVAEVWKTGLGLKEMARGDDGVVGRKEIAAAVEKLMRPDSAEGADMRRRAALLKDAARAASQEGGSSWKDITSFIDFVSR